jgi:hypothetical protein
MKQKRSFQHSNAVENVPISKILASLTAAQAWSVTTTLAIVVAAVFTLGYKLGGIATVQSAGKESSQITTLQTENQTLKQDLSAMEDKDFFLSLCLRFEKAPEGDPIRTQSQHSIEDWIRSRYASGDIEYRKGQVGRPMITFPDGTSWPLPVTSDFNCASLLMQVVRESPNPPKGRRQIIVVTR